MPAQVEGELDLGHVDVLEPVLRHRLVVGRLGVLAADPRPPTFNSYLPVNSAGDKGSTRPSVKQDLDRRGRAVTDQGQDGSAGSGLAGQQVLAEHGVQEGRFAALELAQHEQGEAAIAELGSALAQLRGDVFQPRLAVQHAGQAVEAVGGRHGVPPEFLQRVLGGRAARLNRHGRWPSRRKRERMASHSWPKVGAGEPMRRLNQLVNRLRGGRPSGHEQRLVPGGIGQADGSRRAGQGEGRHGGRRRTKIAQDVEETSLARTRHPRK